MENNYHLHYVRNDDCGFLHCEGFRTYNELRRREAELMKDDSVLLVWRDQQIRKGNQYNF